MGQRIPASERTHQSAAARAAPAAGNGDGDARAELIKLAVRKIVEEALEAEVSEAVGRGYYASGATTPGAGYRNGYRRGRLRTVIIPSANEWTGDPTPLEDDWHHTALDSLTFVQSSPDQVHALVVFSRYQANGQRYVSYRTLWIVTRIDGHWGIQVRSTFTP